MFVLAFLEACSGSSTSGGTSGFCATGQSPTGSVAATVAGTDAISFTLNCVNGVPDTSGRLTDFLNYIQIADGGVVTGVVTLDFFYGFSQCPTPAPGTSFDLSQTSCLQVSGTVSLSAGGANVQFKNVTLSPPYASGTFTLSAWSSASGGTVAGTFSNAILPADSQGGGQLSLSGSYSAVNR